MTAENIFWLLWLYVKDYAIDKQAILLTWEVPCHDI